MIEGQRTRCVSERVGLPPSPVGRVPFARRRDGLARDQRVPYSSTWTVVACASGAHSGRHGQPGHRDVASVVDVRPAVTGAIPDDGYGRFSITRDGVEHTVKPHRYAVALALGVPRGWSSSTRQPRR